jgi:hypothetical protein
MEAGEGFVVKRGAMRRYTGLVGAIDLWRKLKDAR